MASVGMFVRPLHRRGRGLADFTLEIHQIQKVTSRPRIAQRSVMRLEFDPVELAQFPETVAFVCGVAPTYSCDGA